MFEQVDPENSEKKDFYNCDVPKENLFSLQQPSYLMGKK